MGAPGNIAPISGAAGVIGGAASGVAAGGAGSVRSTAASGATPLDPAKKARLAKAVKDFEAILLGMMMKSMRSSVPKDEESGESFGGDMMESMFDEEVA
ncbi:MAG TPA: rod-binding protein, partial [Bacteroidota bacterium]|nr:rod-binding protein [Bacteroidota bacterium]